MTTDPGRPFDPSPFAINRRAFLGHYAGAIGTLALSCLLEEAARRAAAGRRPALRRRGRGPARSRSSACSSTAGRARWTSSTPSRRWRSITASRTRASWRSTSTSRRATCSSRRSGSGRTAGRARCSASWCRTWRAMADDLTLVRSMSTDSVDHETALRLIHTGKILAGRPTWGSWVVYGLGTENRNLPAYVVLGDPGGLPVDGVRNWSSGWLPAVCQGTPFRSGDAPVLHLEDAGRRDARGPRRPARLPRRAEPHPPEPPSGRRASWRRGSPTSRSPRRCRRPCPRRSTCASESEATRRMYGLDDPVDPRVRHPMPAGPPAGRAGRPVRPALPERPALGHAQQERRDAQVALRPDRQAQRRPGPGPEAARAAGRDDRALDGRVRPAAGLAGQGRPRPQPPRLLALAGRRRVQAGLRPRGHRRVRLQGGREGRDRLRPPGDAPARPGPRPPQARPIPTKAGSTPSPTPRSPRPGSCRSCWREGSPESSRREESRAEAGTTDRSASAHPGGRAHPMRCGYQPRPWASFTIWLSRAPMISRRFSCRLSTRSLSFLTWASSALISSSCRFCRSSNCFSRISESWPLILSRSESDLAAASCWASCSA